MIRLISAFADDSQFKRLLDLIKRPSVISAKAMREKFDKTSKVILDHARLVLLNPTPLQRVRTFSLLFAMRDFCLKPSLETETQLRVFTQDATFKKNVPGQY